MLTEIAKSPVPNVELSRRKLLYFKTVYSKKIVQLSEELDIEDIPDIDFDEPFQSFDTVEQELTHLRLRVKKLQRIVFHLKIAVDEKECERLKKPRNSDRYESNNNLDSQRRENFKIIRKLDSKRFPRKTMSVPREMLIKKLKLAYERKVREYQEYCELVECLRMNPVISIKTVFVQPETPVPNENVTNKIHDVGAAAVQPVLSLEEISAFLQKMCQPLPKPLSPIKSPERQGDYPFSVTRSGVLESSYGTAAQGPNRQLNFDDVPNDYDSFRNEFDMADEVSNIAEPIDLNSELITSAIVTSLNV